MRCYGCGKRETLALYKFCLRLVQSHLAYLNVDILGIHQCIVLFLQAADSRKNLRLGGSGFIDHLCLLYLLIDRDKQFLSNVTDIVLQSHRIS